MDKPDKYITPSQLKWPVLLMNFPFSVDNSNPNNIWMLDDRAKEDYEYDIAFKQWMELYHMISRYTLIYVLPSKMGLQDQVYVANLGCYLSEVQIGEKDVILLANFKSKPRVGEDIVGAKFFSYMGYKLYQSPFHWEGEADLKYIRNKVYCGGYGIRTDVSSFNWMMTNFDMDIISVKMTDEKLYHFDCVFMPITNNKSLVATSVLSSNDIKKLESITEIVEVPKKYIYNGWTNSIILGNKFLHAPHSEDTHKKEFTDFVERLGYEPILVNLTEFEKSGADLSCMIMHLNYNK